MVLWSFPVVDPPKSGGRVCALFPVCGPMASHGCLALWKRSHRPVCHFNAFPYSSVENQPSPVRVCVSVVCFCTCACMCLLRRLRHTCICSLLIMTQPEGQRTNNRCGVIMKLVLTILNSWKSFIHPSSEKHSLLATNLELNLEIRNVRYAQRWNKVPDPVRF